jgi:hypothetical protein
MSDAVSNQARPQRHSKRGTARSWPEKSNVSGKNKASQWLAFVGVGVVCVRLKADFYTTV